MHVYLPVIVEEAVRNSNLCRAVGNIQEAIVAKTLR